MSKKKVLLIGWDAADWKAINPIMDSGQMPALQGLVDGGVSGKLLTIDPPYSPMIWSSIATGKRPYKHGIHGFTEVAPDGKSVRPVMSTSRKVKGIWNILSQCGYKTHVVGWWPSHPAEPINGIAISDMFQKAKSSTPANWKMPDNTVHPAEMADFFAQLRVHPNELTGEHILPFVPNADKIDQRKDRRLSAVAKVTAEISSLHAAFTNIIRTQDWDFAALYLDGIDHYCHGFMKYHPPHRSHISKADFDLYNYVITAAYRFHDMMLRRLLELVDDDTTVILISDHGFQPDHLRPRNIPREPAGPAYEHSPHGIIVAKGPNIRKDEIVYGASVIDITPTILSIFGLPIAEDMDGKVLVNLFDKVEEPTLIPSWEDVEGEAGMPSEPDTSNDPDAQQAMLDQLAELGYIEKQEGDMNEAVEKTRRECDFNLARAYIDGGEIEQAIPILEKLKEERPEEARFAFRLATCYQMIGDLKNCRAAVNHLRELDVYDGPTLDVMEGSLLIGERQPRKALELFRQAESKVDPTTSRVSLQIARCYMLLSRFQDAINALERELEIDPDNPVTHQLLGSAYLKLQEYAPAAEYFLNAIGLDYHSPAAHYQLGQTLYLLGKYEEASNALEVAVSMVPEYNAARELLVKLYHTYLDQPEKAREHESKFASTIKGTIYIVSGLPRTGTSMMMQMLHKGGLDVFTDGERGADDNNPLGYYEHEVVKTLPRNKRWLPKAKDKAVKVIANLLPHLPMQYNYKIVFMERNLYEVVTSQRKMLQRMGKKTQKDEVLPTRLIKSFEQTLAQVKRWAAQNPNVEVLYMNHKDVIASPFEQAIRINEFMDYQLLPELMAEVVDSKLHREKAKPVEG